LSCPQSSSPFCILVIVNFTLTHERTHCTYVEAQADLESRLEAAFDRELLELFMERLRNRVEPATWKAFRLTTVESLSASATAQRLATAVGNIDRGEHRVQPMRPQTVPGLERAGGERADT
jgi:hypothetical protein